MENNQTTIERAYEHLKTIGPSHHSQIARALAIDERAAVAALKELHKQGKIRYRVPSYYDNSLRPVIPYRESDPSIERSEKSLGQNLEKVDAEEKR